MRQSLVFLYVLMLAGCNGVGTHFAEITGFSYLHDKRDSRAITTDKRIEDSAIIELNRLDDVKQSAYFNITSYNAKVLVTGEAVTEEVREKIISNIRIISGVKLVHNELAVAPLSTVESRSEDSLLTIKVKEALAEIDDIQGFDASRVKVVSENQVVYLLGLVHKEEGIKAAKAVQNVEGVRQIVTVFEYIDIDYPKK